MNRIAELRKKLGLTQTRLGEEIGVSQQTISKYENGDENIPGDMLLALSKFFEYSNAIVHAFQKFRAPFSGKIVHIFPEQSAVI